MRRFFHYILIISVALAVSCRQQDLVPEHVEADPVEKSFLPGKVKVKVSEDLADMLVSGETELMTGTQVKRTFAHGGKYEDRMRKAGLHLWFDVEFDESAPLTKTGNDLLGMDGVEIVEFMPVPVITDKEYFFNDPDLRKQWHYTNRGNVVTGRLEGCDINVLPAWERGVVGSDDVIVAVLDGGVDLTHEDLMGNLWQGKDPEGNPIHGYNFVHDTYTIYADDHGTHVAGTVAAVNNNGIGVSGVAGGDAQAGIPGARIMSCQIMHGDDGGDEAAALVWAANNGAVIAQNSWGYLDEENVLTETPAYISAAIDYFNEFAGCDENGNQLPDSPMKGGVVIFAAGNESRQIGYPAAYEGCIAVSAIAGDFKLASYSNYGDWIDIAAPGGDAAKNQLVLSTVSNNSYDSYQGTSMACPHVSGVAALILSEFGGQGFTREDLIDRLLKTATDISLSQRQMGAGMVNASAAVAPYGECLPNVPEFAEYEQVSGASLLLKYVMPETNQGVETREIKLYCSTEAFTEPSEDILAAVEHISRPEAGDTLRFTLENLSFNTTYHISICGCDVFGNASPMTENITIKTRDNLAPVIEALDGTEMTLKQHMTVKLRFRITDPENALKEIVYKQATEHDALAAKDDLQVLTIDARNIPAGTYSSLITAADDFGKASECEIRFTIEENVAPSVANPLNDVLFTGNAGSRKIQLSDFIKDEDGESLKFTAESSSETVVKASVAGDVLTLNSAGYGEAVVTVTGTDAMSKSVQATFRVVVRDGSKAFDLYPNPVTDGKLHVRASSADEVSLKITGSSGAVIYDAAVVPDPFNPAVADISGSLPGVYSVRITSADGKVFKQNIVKL